MSSIIPRLDNSPVSRRISSFGLSVHRYGNVTWDGSLSKVCSSAVTPSGSSTRLFLTAVMRTA